MNKTNWWVKKCGEDIGKRYSSQLSMFPLNNTGKAAKLASIMKVRIDANKEVPAIYHNKTHEFIYILTGSVTAKLNNDNIFLESGDLLYLPPKIWHSFHASKLGVSALSIYLPKINMKKPDIVFKKIINSKGRHNETT